jgi:hypothetical protein
LRLRDLRQPPCKFDKLPRRPVSCRSCGRELLFLVSLPGRRVFLVSLSPRSFVGKFSRQPLDVGLQRGDVRFEGEHVTGASSGTRTRVRPSFPGWRAQLDRKARRRTASGVTPSRTAASV